MVHLVFYILLFKCEVDVWSKVHAVMVLSFEFPHSTWTTVALKGFEVK